MFEVRVVGEFAASHYLKNYPGDCQRLHGHNWKVEVFLQGAELNSYGMLYDFKDLKKNLQEILALWDHRVLNECDDFMHTNPTAEHIAFVIFQKIKLVLPKEVFISKVTVWENDRCFASYISNRNEPY